MKNKLKDFVRKISGLSTPIGGITWTPVPNERQIVYKLLQQLGDRRLIRHYHGGFEYRAVINSLKIMRGNVTSALSDLKPD